MKKKLSLFLCMALLGTTSILSAAFKEVSLNGEWDFTFQKKTADDKASIGQKLQVEKNPALPEESAYDIKLNVPDYICFNTDRFATTKWSNKNLNTQSHVVLSGLAFYKKSLDVPKDWKGKSVQLYIGRALEQVYIYVNGKIAISYPYSYLVPFKTDLSELLNYGEKNELVIAVDNSKDLSIYARYGGIISKVSLLVSNGPGLIGNAYFKTGETLHDVICNVDLSSWDKNTNISSSAIKWKIKEWNQSEILEEGIQRIEKINDLQSISWEIKSKKIKPWSPNAPYLYTMEMIWEKDGKVIDSLAQRFGIRKWSAEDRNLKLNGMPIYLRQFYTFPLRSTHARFPTDKKYWLAFFQLIKERGYNSVDWLLETASQEALEAADESGIIIQTGAGTKLSIGALEKCNTNFKESVISEIWTATALWTRIYPSMSIYCIGGEMRYYDNFIEDVRKINDITKKFNPESLLMPNQAMCGIEYKFVKEDIPGLTAKPFLHHAARLAEITKCTNIFGSYPRGAFSYSPFASSWNITNEELVIYEHPLISHEVMESNKQNAPYPDDGIFTSLRDGMFGIEYLCYMWGHPKSKKAVEERISKQDNKTRIYYDNVNRLHSIICKYVFEKLRKCSNITGYQDLNGLAGLNIFLEDCPGYSPEKMRRFNNDSVILLDFDDSNCRNRCHWEKEPFSADVMISLFAGKDIPFGELSWELKDGERILARNFSEINTIKDGTVKKLETIKLDWPEVKETRKLNLKVTFIGFGLNISNDWDFWIFKKNIAPEVKAACRSNVHKNLKKRYPAVSHIEKASSEKLWVTDELTENVIAHLDVGGDVLLLGGKPFPVNNEWPTFNPGYRNSHTNGTVIYKHPIFENIPNEGWGDWQFYPLLEGTPSIVFRDERTGGYGMKNIFHDPMTSLMKDIAFKPILEVIHRARQADFANIFEVKVGKGKLFVSTCRTDLSNPVCTALLDSIFKYITGAEFSPTVKIESSLLSKLLEGNVAVIKDNEMKFSANNFIGGTFISQYGAFDCIPRDAVSVAAHANTQLIFELKNNNIPKSTSSDLVLTVDGQDSDKPINVKIKILLNEKCIYDGPMKCVKKSWSLWNIPFKKELLKQGTNVLEFKSAEEVTAGVYSYFLIAGVTIKGNVTNSRESKNINNKSKDVMSPIMKLVAMPALEQFGHQNTGTIQTVFSINAEDNESGINKIEISVDKEPFKTYKGPFKLEKGVHNLRCRCTDNAENQTSIMKGVTEEGDDADNLDLEIK